MSKTKTSAGGALATAVALVVALGFAYGLVKKGRSDGKNDKVVFTVTFGTENPGRRFVDIVILVDNAPHTADKTILSPWTRVLKLHPGQTAVLTATQSASNKLSCAVNGEIQETRMFPGSVVCTHKRF
jgi:hypothetical protein